MKSDEQSDPVISLSNVTKVFNKKNSKIISIENITLNVFESEFCVLIGPSGCGKSTMLNMISGLDFPKSGNIKFYGETVSGANTAVGYMTQNDALLPWKDTWHNIALPLTLKIRKCTKDIIADRVSKFINLVGLRGFEKHYPHQLSGGMRRRVALARILICDPKVLLMDEPFGALDAQLKRLMQKELLRLWTENKKTVIFVTHDIDEAITLGDRVLVMSPRPGKILRDQKIDIPRPRDVFRVRFHARFAELYQGLLECLGESEVDIG